MTQKFRPKFWTVSQGGKANEGALSWSYVFRGQFRRAFLFFLFSVLGVFGLVRVPLWSGRFVRVVKGRSLAFWCVRSAAFWYMVRRIQAGSVLFALVGFVLGGRTTLSVLFIFRVAFSPFGAKAPFFAHFLLFLFGFFLRFLFFFFFLLPLFFLP